MASTNKTPQLGLNQWAAGDEVIRTDFNGDNLKIDTAMEVALNNRKVGKYKGDGTDNRQIECGFRPSFVLMSNSNVQGYDELDLILEDGYHRVTGTGTSFNSTIALNFNATGFATAHVSAVNILNDTYRYIAFR